MMEDDAPQSNDTELDQRRRALGEKLGTTEKAGRPGTQHSSDAMGLGSIYKLSAEFVGGVFAGGLLGWIIDHFAGSSPWGLIVCTLLGFAAGILNMMRAVGLTRSWGQK